MFIENKSKDWVSTLTLTFTMSNRKITIVNSILMTKQSILDSRQEDFDVESRLE